MPHELNSVMVKSKDVARPSVQGFYLSTTSSTSRSMLADIATAHPEAMTEDNLAAVLSPAQALGILTGWLVLHQKGRFHADSAAICQEFGEMIECAQNGHSWIITSE
ncbi:hypothetical protein ACOI1H_14710 [Loktanella sp. DJP18]|uniref:hypothetical protein n=1 Tax=Loktanella sp. DJP18 TaxID=3409788 RepID=UPI003BB74BD3